MPELPPEVERLLAERAEARAARDWERADALRDRMAELGWEPQDGPSGSTARPILRPTSPAEGGTSPIDAPATVDASVQVVAEDHPEDLERCLAGLAAHPPSFSWELVVVSHEPSFELEPIFARHNAGVEPVVVATDGRIGWAGSRTLGMHHSRGEITILLDTSLEPTGDFVTPLLHAFDDPRVGIAGGWGVTSADLRQFTDAPPGEVDAIEGYCLAIRREAVRAVGGFDRRFRYYRNADLDLSFAVRAAGWIAVRTAPLPLAKHEHRGWTALPEAERDRLSRRNFYRFLDHWRDRRDLLLRPGTADR